MLVLGTTSERGVLQQLNLRGFSRELAVPAVSDHNELQRLLSSTGAFADPADITEAMYELQNATGSQRVNLGVAEVLSTLNTAQVKAEEDSSRSLGMIFAAELSDVINTNNPM